MKPNRRLLARSAWQVAPLLLGATVISDLDSNRVLVRITEVEAYEGAEDPASHAFRGRTKRNAVMFGPAGHLYCYFVYGMHWCANVTCGQPGTAAGVLLRAAEILEGEAVVRGRTKTRPPSLNRLASGPARLARSLGLTGALTGIDLLSKDSPVRLLELDEGQSFQTGPRVGVAAAAEYQWRFWVPDAPSVSSYRPAGNKRAGATRQTEQS
jgi:DNA-3-methyladenine glycosylase